MNMVPLRKKFAFLLLFVFIVMFIVTAVAWADGEMSPGAQAAWWFLTAVACIFLGIFALIGKKPKWWQTAIAIVIAISGIVFGKPWALPPGP